jgi:hypothetical protein
MAIIVGLTDQQRRMLIDTRQLWEAWRVARERRRSFSGSLSWKTSKGHEYLVKIASGSRARVRKMTSLGPRSDLTELTKTSFERGRDEAEKRFKTISIRLGEQSRLNRAVGIGRVPIVAAKILRRMDGEGLLGRNCIVAGTNALYAYESSAGVMIERSLLETGDLDLLLEARARLRLTLRGAEPSKIIDILKSADSSFEKAANGSSNAANAAGYLVELIKAEPRPPWKEERSALGEDDLQAAAIRNMRWVLNAPRFEAVAVGEDGAPVPIAAPDPRAFAVYKLWMGQRDPTRDPVKRDRDVGQAYAVAEIVREYLPNLPFTQSELQMFPEEVRRLAVDSGLIRSPSKPDVADPFFST